MFQQSAKKCWYETHLNPRLDKTDETDKSDETDEPDETDETDETDEVSGKYHEPLQK